MTIEEDMGDMTAIRNACVARGNQPAQTNTIVYTVPAGYVLLLKDLELYSQGAAEAHFSVTITDSTSSTGIPIVQTDLASATSYQKATWVALNGGDNIYVGTTGSACAYWVSGALLPYASALPTGAIAP